MKVNPFNPIENTKINSFNPIVTSKEKKPVVKPVMPILEAGNLNLGTSGSTIPTLKPSNSVILPGQEKLTSSTPSQTAASKQANQNLFKNAINNYDQNTRDTMTPIQKVGQFGQDISNTGGQAIKEHFEKPRVNPINDIQDLKITVNKGDTLESLAKQYNTSVGYIKNMSGISDINNIKEGQIIRVPNPKAADASVNIVAGFSPMGLEEVLSGGAEKTIKNFARTISKTSEPEAVANIIKTKFYNIPEETLKIMSGDLSKINTEEGVVNYFNFLKNKVGREAQNPAPSNFLKEGIPQPIPESYPIETTIGKETLPKTSVDQGLEDMLPSQNPVDDLGVSLFKNIPQRTPVNKRVNILDTYVRTPHYVMEKIGLGQEAKDLRSAQEALSKETRDTEQVIRNWAKEVPGKQSNENIFNYLNGEAVKLSPGEEKVALEIRSLLKDLAVRQGIPEDKQIDWYITHIWEQSINAGEVPEDIAKLIADKIPGQVYNPFLLERAGREGFKRDTWAAVDAYIKRSIRKIHMDPVLQQIKEKAGSTLDTTSLEKSQFKYLEEYIRNINMRPSDFDTGFNNLIGTILNTKLGKILTFGQGEKLGPRPYSTILRKARGATYLGMLGGSLSSAIRNLSQGINTYAVLGEKYTALGYINMFKKGMKEEAQREGVFDAGFIQDKILNSFFSTLKQKGQDALFYFFQKAEKANRLSTYAGAKAKAIAEGMGEREAIDYAKSVVRQTQFLFDTIDTPVGMANDTAKTLTQFQSFGIKQIEFLTQLAKDKKYAGIVRYLIAGLLFTYTIGKSFDMKPEQLIPSIGIGAPPSLKFPLEVGKALFNTPDQYGNTLDAGQKNKNIGNSAVGLFPAGNQIRKSYQGYTTVDQGASKTSNGKFQYKVEKTPENYIKGTLFGKSGLQETQDFNEKKAKKKSKNKKVNSFNPI